MVVISFSWFILAALAVSLKNDTIFFLGIIVGNLWMIGFFIVNKWK
jgi:hypothetical protein